jgi:hypothetical protein
MVQVVQMFPPTVLTAAAATLYTNTGGPSNQVLARGRIRLANTTGSPVQVSAWAVPSGGSEGVGNNFCPGLTVAPNAFLDVDVPVLAIGDFIQALASAATSITASSLDGVIFP